DLKALDFLGGLDGMDVQFDRIQFQLLGRLDERLESNSGLAFDSALLEIRSDIDQKVKDLDIAIRRIFAGIGRINGGQESGGLNALNGGRVVFGVGAADEHGKQEQRKESVHDIIRWFPLAWHSGTGKAEENWRSSSGSPHPDASPIGWERRRISAVRTGNQPGITSLPRA